MKKLICVVLAAAVFAAIADEPPPFDLKKKPQTEEEKAARKAYIEDRFNKHTGGRLIVPGSLKGKFVYVNAQKRAPSSGSRIMLTSSTNPLSSPLRLRMVSSLFPIQRFRARLRFLSSTTRICRRSFLPPSPVG